MSKPCQSLKFTIDFVGKPQSNLEARIFIEVAYRAIDIGLSRRGYLQAFRTHGRYATRHLRASNS
jgi:hypothetical protein